MAQKKKSNIKKDVKTVKKPSPDHSGGNTAIIRIIQFAAGLTALFLLFCFIFPGASGIVGQGIRTGLFGAFGVSSVLIPVLFALIAVFLKRIYEKGRLIFCIIWGSLSLLFLSVFCGVFSLGAESRSVPEFFEICSNFSGGGVVGGMLAQLIKGGLGADFTGIISALLLIVFF